VAKTNKPPGHDAFSLLSQLARVQKDTPEFLCDCQRRFGDVTSLSLSSWQGYLICHPDDVRRVLQDNHHNYSKATIQYDQLSDITGRGLLTSQGDLWLAQRRLMQPAFNRPRLMALDRVIVPAVEQLGARWAQAAKAGENLNVDAEMMSLALEIVGKALFSIDLSRDAPRLTRAVMTCLDAIVGRVRFPLRMPDFIPTPGRLHFAAALNTLDMTLYNMVAERRASRDPGDDLLAMLLNARDETGRGMDDVQLRDELMTILVAGHETVASALTWTWYLLAKNPGAYDRLRQEAQNVLSGRAPASTDLEHLNYSSAVFSEALRLYPPAWVITRRALAEDKLGGYAIPPGSTLIISPYVMHRLDSAWERPLDFSPERFLDGKKAPQFAYIPFGAGPHLCIGAGFARVEAQIILSMLAQQFRLELLRPAQAVKAEALVTLRPKGGLWMRPIPL